MSGAHRLGASLLGCLLSAAFTLFAPGCRDDEPHFEVLSLEGTIEKLDLAPDGTGEIRVSYYNEKRAAVSVGTGWITHETEVVINGVVARPQDLREGDRVRGVVRVSGKGPEAKRIALKIRVSRA